MIAQEQQQPVSSKRHQIIKEAWRRFAVYDYNAIRSQRQFFGMRKWILGLGVTVAALAVTYAGMQQLEAPAWAVSIRKALRYVIILLPITVSGLQAYSHKFKRGVNFVLLRHTAEQLKQEIFLYRTRTGIYSAARTKKQSRHLKLASRLKLISSRLMKTDLNQAALALYRGNLPPSGAIAEGDGGFSDITPEEYLKWRLDDQFDFYRRRGHWLNRQLRFFQGAIFFFGGLGTFLAAIGFEVWVAVTTTVAGAVISFLEIKQVETTLIIYNQSATDLDNLRLWWLALTDEQKNQAAFEKLVRNTESVIQNEHTGWAQEMRDMLTELYKVTAVESPSDAGSSGD